MNVMTAALVAGGVVLNATDTGDNQPPVDPKANVLKQARGYGEQDGAGANAKPSLYLGATEAGKAKAITSDGDDAAAIYAEYSKGRAKRKGIGWQEDKSTPQQVSKLRTMIALGEMANVDGVAINVRVSNAIMDKVRLGQKLDKSAGDILLSAARIQLGIPDRALDDDQIAAAFVKKVPDQKLESDFLGAIRDAAERVRKNDEAPVSDDSRALLDVVITDLAQRIKDLGGTSKDRKALEKAMRAKIEADMKAQMAQDAIGSTPLPGGVARY